MLKKGFFFKLCQFIKLDKVNWVDSPIRFNHLGTFAETAIVDYCLSFANQEKNISAFHFPLQQTNENLPLLFSSCSEQKEIDVSQYIWKMELYI